MFLILCDPELMSNTRRVVFFEIDIRSSQYSNVNRLDTSLSINISEIDFVKSSYFQEKLIFFRVVSEIILGGIVEWAEYFDYF